ncbi:MAG TPA: TIR-like domain-containing protein [Blastocatellia bacterium]|nr:TIR-like domain-containing protein [Blastocatellia bacterium]
MARKVFFSFHYKRDSVRAGQIRNSNVVKNRGIETSDFIDAAKWEEVQGKGDQAIKDWIASQLNGTSVTAVLIGARTAGRKWIQYEINESLKHRNGLLGIYIHNCPLFDSSCDTKGINPFDNLTLTINGVKRKLSEIYKTYDWIDDDGRSNLGSWVEAAAKQAGR